MHMQDPQTGKMVEVVRRKYVLKMKTGTARTVEDPDRPEIADLLKGKAHDWSVNQRDGSISVACQNKDHQILARTHVIHNG